MYEVNAVVTTFILIILYLRNYVDESRLIHIIKANAITLTLWHMKDMGDFREKPLLGMGLNIWWDDDDNDDDDVDDDNDVKKVFLTS